MRRILCATSVAILLDVAPAWATGGFSCTVDDANLKFETQSALGSGMGAPILNLEARADIELKDTPADLKQVDLSKHLVHSWMLHPELRLLFYRERDNDKPHAHVELVISAMATDDEGTADGSYDLTVFTTDSSATAEPLKATGKVSCFIE
jgi:hypothetical protein